VHSRPASVTIRAKTASGPGRRYAGIRNSFTAPHHRPTMTTNVNGGRRFHATLRSMRMARAWPAGRGPRASAAVGAASHDVGRAMSPFAFGVESDATETTAPPGCRRPRWAGSQGGMLFHLVSASKPWSEAGRPNLGTMLRFLALDLVLHHYIAVRLLPAMPGGMPVSAVALAAIAASAAFLPFATTSRGAGRGSQADRLTYAGLIAAGAFSSL